MFLLEVYDIGDEVLKEWMEYVRNRSSLVRASLATNTAIELVRQAESRFYLFLERPSGYPASKFPTWTLPAVLHYAIHPDTHHHSVETVVLLKASGFTTGDQGCPRTRFCQWPVYSELNFFLCSLQGTPSQLMHSSAFSVIPSSKVDGRDVPDDTIRTLELTYLTHCIHLFEDDVKDIAFDGITRGIQTMVERNKIPVWVVFGIQILLDVQRMLDTTELQSRPLEQLQVKTRYAMGMQADQKPRADPFLRTDAQVSSDNDWGCVIDRIEQWALKDTYNKHLVAYEGLEKRPILSLNATTPYVFFQRQPVLCGLMEYQLRLQSRQSGLRYEREGANICMLGHLYVAGRLLYPESPTWPDMKLVLYSQGYEYLFYGVTPKTLDEAHRKAMLAAGRSLLNVACDGR
jgi:hypothetical protein